MTDAPRLPLVDPADAPENVRAILEAWPLGLHRTIAHNPVTLSRWMVFAEHILRGNSLPERDREIAILRVAWNTRSRYEWGMHGRLARRIGMTGADLDAIVDGPDTERLPEHERALIRAVDEIQTGWKISDPTWKILAARYTPGQLIDLIFVTGQFMLVAVTLNSLNIPMEDQEGLEPFPVLR